VDLRTQYSYQMMDPYFVGLIFSVYNSDPVTMVETRDIIAFQAVADIEVRTSHTRDTQLLACLRWESHT
jgi:hypothetical protein